MSDSGDLRLAERFRSATDRSARAATSGAEQKRLLRASEAPDARNAHHTKMITRWLGRAEDQLRVGNREGGRHRLSKAILRWHKLNELGIPLQIADAPSLSPALTHLLLETVYMGSTTISGTEARGFGLAWNVPATALQGALDAHEEI